MTIGRGKTAILDRSYTKEEAHMSHVFKDLFGSIQFCLQQSRRSRGEVSMGRQTYT